MLSPTSKYIKFSKFTLAWTMRRWAIQFLIFPFLTKPNLLQANVPFIYFLNTSENLWFSDLIKGYRDWTLFWNRLKKDWKKS